MSGFLLVTMNNFFSFFKENWQTATPQPPTSTPEKPQQFAQSRALLLPALHSEQRMVPHFPRQAQSIVRLHLQPCPHSRFQKKGLWILYLWVSKRLERPGTSTKPEIHNGSSLSVPVCMWIDRHHPQSSFSYLCGFKEVSLNTRERILATLLIHSSWYRSVLSRWVQNSKNRLTQMKGFLNS